MRISGLESPVKQSPRCQPRPSSLRPIGAISAAWTALEQGADINFDDPATGLSALHIAVGTNDLALCRYLIEECDASIVPDRSGRWPTLIAAQCRVSDELGDYIAEKEASNIPAAIGARGKPS